MAAGALSGLQVRCPIVEGRGIPTKMRARTVPSPRWGEGQGEGENAAREVGSVHLMFMAKWISGHVNG